jgi:UDP-N-acetylglucosamine--N-acetylmuramyl-(pentapeptide) pyrophosphoryl-undecaprenol N-acetylglucosamine transferase
MNAVNRKILFAGGGTGGHVYPALACIEALEKKGDFNFLYVGGYRGIENKIIDPDKLPFKKIWISGLQRYLTLKNLLFPLKLLISLFQSLSVLLKFKPQVVVGTGGYVSGPVVYTASKIGIPTLIQEQDSYPGATTRLLAKYADYICVPHESVRKYFPGRSDAVLVFGVPIRGSLQLVEKEKAAEIWKLQPDKPVILVFGGSQGARALNLAIQEIATRMKNADQVQWLWQTGKNNYDEVKYWPVSSRQNVVVTEYIESMAIAYSAADIIVSRAGAITLAELALVQKPCILVPYPHAAADHQKKNAEVIAQQGAAVLIEEGENFSENLTVALEQLLNDKEKYTVMGNKWKQFANPDAADRIADQIIYMMKA